MSIQQNNKKIKISDFEIPNFKERTKTLIIIFIIFTVSIISYFLGRYSVKNNPNFSQNSNLNQSANLIQNQPISDQNTLSTSPKEASQNQNMTNLSSQSSSNNSGSIYASPNGSKYYLPWCNGGKTLKTKIYFKTELEAQSKGYTKSSTCK